MKLGSTRVGSLVGMLSVVTGLMAVACTAAPTGSFGNDSQDQTEKDDNNTTLPASNPSSNNSAPATGTQNDPSTPPAPTPGTEGGLTPPPPPPPPAGDPQVCAASPGFEACFDCCDQQNPGGMQVDFEAWDTCACQTPGVCKAACGNNFCAGGQPSAACQQCLDNNTLQCDDIADAACQANPACTAAFACTETAQCWNKP